MTTNHNKLSNDETPIKLNPETITDLDPENEAKDIKGGGRPGNSHETCV